MKLLHLCDSLFPIGSFGYSDGLEAAAIEDAAGLCAWMDVCLDDTFGRLDAPTVLRAWTLSEREEWDGLARLDEEADALRPAAATRRANRAMGLRLLTTWQGLYPDRRAAKVLALANAGFVRPVLPVAFAVAAYTAGIDRRDTAGAFAYTRLAATISAAMRLMSIGQTDAHRLLARTLDRVPSVVAEAVARDSDPEVFTPLVDIAAMRHQYLHSRLFRS